MFEFRGRERNRSRLVLAPLHGMVLSAVWIPNG